MASLLARSARFLDRTLHRVAEEEIVFVRGNEELQTVAVPGRRDTKLLDVEGEQASEVEFDWIIASDNLRLLAGRTEPRKGDIIRWKDGNGACRTYKVLPNEFDRCFESVDQFQQLLRVHTKLIGVKHE